MREIMHLSFVTFALAAAACGIEALVGYPAAIFAAIGHPVTWMGRLIARLDAALNRDQDPPGLRRAAGFLALACLLLATSLCVAGLVVLVSALLGTGPVGVLVLALCTSACLAQRSLAEHVGAVARALESEGLDAGRRAVGQIVGRDVAALDEGAICRAAIESLAENFSDGIIAPAFWIAMLGPFGGFLYKAVNTADSMIGHRTKRHAAFGFAAAKFDDLLNLVPARLAALWICVAAFGSCRSTLRISNCRSAWRITWRDARGHPSPNAGWPEAAMAGALGIRLGGPRSYQSRVVEDAWIGEGRSALDAADIRRALALYRRACFINLAVLAAMALALIARG